LSASVVSVELVEQVQQAGRRVIVLTPQRQQVVDMEKAGFPHRQRSQGFWSGVNPMPARSWWWKILKSAVGMNHEIHETHETKG